MSVKRAQYLALVGSLVGHVEHLPLRFELRELRGHQAVRKLTVFSALPTFVFRCASFVCLMARQLDIEGITDVSFVVDLLVLVIDGREDPF